MFLWADSYRSVSVPDWGAIGSTAYWVLIVVRSFGVFTVPAFLFSSGYFSVYIARSYLPTKSLGSSLEEGHKPYHTLCFLVGGGLCWRRASGSSVYPPRLLCQVANDRCIVTPLLCAASLCLLPFLSPWVIASVGRSPRLIDDKISALLQAGALVGRYLGRFGAGGTITAWLARLTPWWSLTWWFVYFVLGVVVALNIQRTKVSSGTTAG